MNLTTTYNGKKVFVTGHTGFKGSWLITWLHQLGAKVKGYALAPENDHNLYNALNGDELCESVIADIRDKERLKRELLNFQPDFVFHLAAQPLVRLSYQFPTETFEVNVQGTAHVLDALRFLKKSCIAVMITTDKVYHNLERAYHYKENDRLGGYDPYSASKACAELIIDSYRNSFFHLNKYEEHGKSISVARAGNVIGGGDWAEDRIIPDIVRALSAHRPVEVRNPLSVRPWQHVLEPLHGYLVLAAYQEQDPLQYADAFNFGPYKEDVFTVEELVKTAISCWGSGDYSAVIDRGAVHEASLLQLDISKALEKLNWQPYMSAKQAIEKTISWYRDAVLNRLDQRDLVKQHITSFVQENETV